MKYNLKYGNHNVGLLVPENSQSVTVNTVESKPDKKSFTKGLSDLVRPGINSAGIVVSDKTRLCGYDQYIPWVTEVLKRSGLENNTISFYIAYGTHPRQTEKESIMIYGDSYNEYEFIHHDCDDSNAMIDLCTTERGTHAKIRKDIPKHDLLILFGSVSHHYFAGYGGGRKLLFPGLADRKAIYANHKLFIDFNNMTLNPGCQSGNLTGNPVAEDLYEIDRFIPEKIIITGIPGPRGKISRFMIGTRYKDFLSACRVYDNLYRKDISTKYDNVIASSGGYPKDINFIQTHKSLHNAASFVRDGGNLFLLGECIDGIGNDEFLNIFKGKKEDIFNNLSRKYSGNGGTALSLISKTERINVYMLTELDNRTCNILNINKIKPDEFSTITGKLKGSTAIIKNASIVYC